MLSTYFSGNIDVFLWNEYKKKYTSSKILTRHTIEHNKL